MHNTNRSGRPWTRKSSTSDAMMQNPFKAIQLAQQQNICLTTAHKAVTKSVGLFPHKVSAVDELKDADHQK